MANSEDSQFDDLLDALTDAMLAEQDDVDHILDRFGTSQQQTNGFIHMIRNLRDAFSPQEPSDKFVKSLKRDLMGQSNGMTARLRGLPARVQVAAGFALVAGFMLITRRRLTGGLSSDSNEELPALQQS